MPRRPFSAEGDPLTRLPGSARLRHVWLGSERKKNADESGSGSPFRTVARTSGRDALVLPRGQGDRGVPRNLAGTPTTMKDGNHPRSSVVTTAVTVRKAAGMALRLAVMHRCVTTRETIQSNQELTASDDRTRT
ncbi:hypothetical protein MTO96_032303 [Rhipicephalus appendiculatus]